MPRPSWTGIENPKTRKFSKSLINRIWRMFLLRRILGYWKTDIEIRRWIADELHMSEMQIRGITENSIPEGLYL